MNTYLIFPAFDNVIEPQIIEAENMSDLTRKVYSNETLEDNDLFDASITFKKSYYIYIIEGNIIAANNPHNFL